MALQAEHLSSIEWTKEMEAHKAMQKINHTFAIPTVLELSSSSTLPTNENLIETFLCARSSKEYVQLKIQFIHRLGDWRQCCGIIQYLSATCFYCYANATSSFLSWAFSLIIDMGLSLSLIHI